MTQPLHGAVPPRPHPAYAPYPHAPHPQPLPPAYVAGGGAWPADAHGFAAFLQISLRRAYRLRIEPEEVTPDEREALARAQVVDPTFQAFLAWRRSLLFMVAVLLIPLIVLKAIEIFSVPAGDTEGERSMVATIQALQSLPLIAEIAFCALAWVQLKRWTDWRKQRRALAIGWLAFFLAPFVIYLFPFRSVVEDALGAGAAGAHQAVVFFGLMFSISAMMTLAPKAVSLLPGLVRAALVTKYLFPGSAAPGWLMVLAAPIYALFVYIVLIVPYQITGSGWFVAAIVGIFIAEYLLGRGGYDLARPMTRDSAIQAAGRARRAYVIAMVVTAVFVVAATWSLIEQLDFEVLSVFTLIGTFLTNVWILTLITTDLLIANLDRARGLSAGTTELADEANRALAGFVGAADHNVLPRPPT